MTALRHCDPAGPEALAYYGEIDAASRAYQDEIARLTALAAARWNRSLRRARSRYERATAITNGGTMTTRTTARTARSRMGAGI